jgi:hypothetical protein
MHISISKQIRPDLETKFWPTKDSVSAEYSRYVKENYIDTGILKKVESKVSDDGLILVTTVSWSCEEDFLKFINDPRVVNEYIDPFNDYAKKAGIIMIAVDERNNMIANQGPNPYPNLTIPETWSNVEDFANWWLTSGMPIVFPKDAEVFLSDDATSIALFRKDRFQVELYLIHPEPKVPVHEHPDVEVIKIRLSGRKYPYLSDTLRNGQSHGAGQRLEAEEKGYPLIAIQHWLTREPTTIASMWKGNTVGPKQENLIRRFNPESYIIDGYADITRKNLD